MSKHSTVKAAPPPNLLYDMRAAARAERWERRWMVITDAVRIWVFAGATAGFVALALTLAHR